MSRSRVNKKRFACQHRGFGCRCHRCEQADILEKAASWPKKKYKTDKKKKVNGKAVPKVWSKEELLAEAKRLREEGRKFAK